MSPRRLMLVAGLVATSALAVVAGAVPAVSSGQEQAQRARFDTRLLARVPDPGFPAQAYVHPNRRIYVGTYLNMSGGGTTPSRVFEYSEDGSLLRSWSVPGQVLDGGQGIQVTSSDSRGDIVVLDLNPARVLKLNRATGEFSTYATFSDLKPCPAGTAALTCSPTTMDEPATPNYTAWGPDGSLYVTDLMQGVIWRVPPGGGEAVVWLSDRRLDGGPFGTTGIRLGADRRTLFFAQGSSAGLGELSVASGKLYSTAIQPDGGPGPINKIWESQPGDLPDGFDIARSGTFYIPLVGLPQQIAVVSAGGTELERFPQAPGSGANGSEVPFDSPSSARFLDTRLIVANQSAVAGDANNQALLDVEANETGLPELIPGLDRERPVLRRVSLTQRRFTPTRGKLRGARRGKPARGTKLRFGVTEGGTVGIRIARRGAGGEFRLLTRVRRDYKRGRHAYVFRGRIRDDGRVRWLRRGRYRFAIWATDAAGNRSQRVFRSFRVVR